MDNYEVALVSDAQGAVLKAKNITLNFQGSNALTPSGKGNLVDINLTVDADQESALRDGSLVSGSMKQIAIRGAELETMLITMSEGPDKAKATAKLAIWKTFNTSVQTALTKAMKAQHLLDNPVTV